MLIWTAHKHQSWVSYCCCMLLSRCYLNNNVVIEARSSRKIRHRHSLSFWLNSESAFLVVTKSPHKWRVLNDYVFLQLVQSAILPHFKLELVFRISVYLFRIPLDSPISLGKLERLLGSWFREFLIVAARCNRAWAGLDVERRLFLIWWLELLSFCSALTHFIW